MADEKNDLSRRDFVALSLAAGLAAAAGEDLASAAELPVQVANVDVKTPDGICDATFIHPTTGSHPAARGAAISSNKASVAHTVRNVRALMERSP